MGQRGDRRRRVPAVQGQKRRLLEIKRIQLRRIRVGIQQQGLDAVELGLEDEVREIEGLGPGWKMAGPEKREKDGEQFGVSINERHGALIGGIEDSGEEGGGSG